MQNPAPILTPVDDLSPQIVLKSAFAQRFGGFSDVFPGILTRLVVDGQTIGENIAVSDLRTIRTNIEFIIIARSL